MRSWTLTIGTKGAKDGPKEDVIACSGPFPGKFERIEVIDKAEYDKLEAKLKAALPCFCKGIK